MNATDTPETDAIWSAYVTPYSRKYAETPIASLTNLCRKLERERNDLKRMVELLKTQLTGKLEEVVKNHRSDLTCARGNDTKCP